MRTLHLLGLMAPEYRFFSPDNAPLMLPGSIELDQHEILLAFYQQVISDRPLPRMELEWYSMLHETSARMLEATLGTRGPSGVVLVVKVREERVDLRVIVEHPLIKAFQYVAVSNVHPGSETEELRALLALTHDVRQRARERYEELTERLPLELDAWKDVNDLVRALENPIDVVETVNALIEVQMEGIWRLQLRRSILHGMLTRLLERRSAAEFCALIGIAAKGIEETRAVLGKDAERVFADLQLQGLLREGKLLRWAGFLKEENVLFDLLHYPSSLPTDAQRTERWVSRVRTAVGWTGATMDMERAEYWDAATWNAVQFSFRAAKFAREGRFSLAQEYLSRVDVEACRRASGVAVMFYWGVRAGVAFDKGLFASAESAYRAMLNEPNLPAEGAELAKKMLASFAAFQGTKPETPSQ